MLGVERCVETARLSKELNHTSHYCRNRSVLLFIINLFINPRCRLCRLQLRILFQATQLYPYSYEQVVLSLVKPFLRHSYEFLVTRCNPNDVSKRTRIIRVKAKVG